MNVKGIDPALIGRHRAVIETWNLMGKKLFTPKCEPADLNWNDKIKNNSPTRLVKPIMKYIVESIEIFSTGLVVAPDNSTLLIELNNDPTLQFKLVPAKFCEVSMEKIKEAIQMNEKQEAGRTPMFFRDCNQLTEQVNRLNALEASKCSEVAEEMLSMAKMLNELNNIQKDANDRYYEELGRDTASV